MNLKNVKLFTSISVGTGPSFCEKKYFSRVAVSKSLWNTVVEYESTILRSRDGGFDLWEAEF